VATIEEAVGAYRELAAAQPDAFLPDLATTLGNWAGCLSGVGRREEALTAISEAVEIRRDLAAVNPDAFLPKLASALINQSIGLIGLGRREEAVTAIEEALDLALPMLERSHHALPDAGLMLIETYLRRCDDAGREPIPERVRRLRNVLIAAGQVSEDYLEDEY
jgi:tetratricopeptide (TPR) repeat protein